MEADEAPTSRSAPSGSDQRGVPGEVFDPKRLEAVRASGLIDTAPEEAFDRLTRLAAALLDTPFAQVTVVDDERSYWKSCIGARGAGIEANDLPVEDSFCQYVIGEGRELIVEDVRLDPLTAANPLIERFGVAAWAGYPIRGANEQIIGTFCVIDVREREWSSRDIEILSTLSHAATGEIALRAALESAELAAVMSRERGAHASGLARTLQETLLPPTLPQMPGMEAAALYLPGDEGVLVVGDFYDLFLREGGTWGVVMGDVAGHGVAVAAVAASARGSLRTLATIEPSPARVLAALNEAVLQAAGDDAERLLSVVYATLDAVPEGFVVTLGNAGHMPTLLRRSDGSVEFIGEPGLLLGCQPDLPVTDIEGVLGPGDALVFYTDGVTEARRGPEPFGPERLHALVEQTAPMNAAETVATIEEAVLDWTKGKITDDTAILVLLVPLVAPEQ